MTLKTQCMELHNMGIRHSEISRIVGVSRQRVSQICGKYNPSHFCVFTPPMCVYPNWRNFMNENKITKSELIRRMGLEVNPSSMQRVGSWMRGVNYPQKQSIDLLISATGLTYELLFFRGE